MTSSSPLKGFDTAEVDRAIALSHKVDNIISLIHSLIHLILLHQEMESMF